MKGDAEPGSTLSAASIPGGYHRGTVDRQTDTAHIRHADLLVAADTRRRQVHRYVRRHLEHLPRLTVSDVALLFPRVIVRNYQEILLEVFGLGHAHVQTVGEVGRLLEISDFLARR